jgi:hypothetical protein
MDSFRPFDGAKVEQKTIASKKTGNNSLGNFTIADFPIKIC